MAYSQDDSQAPDNPLPLAARDRPQQPSSSPPPPTLGARQLPWGAGAGPGRLAGAGAASDEQATARGWVGGDGAEREALPGDSGPVASSSWVLPEGGRLGGGLPARRVTDEGLGQDGPEGGKMGAAGAACQGGTQGSARGMLPARSAPQLPGGALHSRGVELMELRAHGQQEGAGGEEGVGGEGEGPLRVGLKPAGAAGGEAAGAAHAGRGNEEDGRGGTEAVGLEEGEALLSPYPLPPQPPPAPPAPPPSPVTYGPANAHQHPLAQPGQPKLHQQQTL